MSLQQRKSIYFPKSKEKEPLLDKKESKRKSKQEFEKQRKVNKKIFRLAQCTVNYKPRQRIANVTNSIRNKWQ